MRAKQTGLQPDRFPEQLCAFPQPVLPKANGAQDRMGGGPRFRIGEGKARLLVGLLQPSLLDQHRGLLKGLGLELARRVPLRQAERRESAAAPGQQDAAAARRGNALATTARGPPSSWEFEHAHDTQILTGPPASGDRALVS